MAKFKLTILAVLVGIGLYLNHLYAKNVEATALSDGLRHVDAQGIGLISVIAGTVVVMVIVAVVAWLMFRTWPEGTLR
jgi:hypothetical protein